jgi:hypothetical protein
MISRTTRQDIRPRAPPGPVVRMSTECRALILEAYPPPVSADMLLSIEIYLDLLNSQGRSEDALRFLRDCEIGARTDIRRRAHEKSRNMLRLIGTSTFTASISVFVRFISTWFGIS